MTEVIRDVNCRDIAHNSKAKLFGDNCNTCGHLIMYADDTTYIVSNKMRIHNQMRINLNLGRMEMFLTDNELVINTGKTAILECMIPQKKGKLNGSPPHLIVNTREGEMKRIVDSKYFRVLGTNLKQNMSWDGHLEKGPKSVMPAVRKQFGILKLMSNFLPRKSRKLLSEGLVLSKLQYLISQWGWTTENM